MEFQRVDDLIDEFAEFSSAEAIKECLRMSYVTWTTLLQVYKLALLFVKLIGG